MTRLSKLISQVELIIRNRNCNDLTPAQRELIQKYAEIMMMQNTVIIGDDHDLSDSDIDLLNEFEQELLRRMQEEIPNEH